MTGWGIHRIADMIGSKNTTTGPVGGEWVRAVPLPYSGGKILAAWSVLTGKAFAVHWPLAGDLEKALQR